MPEASPEARYERPFADIRVVDMSQGVAGPGCGFMLAAHGADVIKIEPPQGDWARGLGTRHGDHTAMSLAVNRSKRGIALGLKKPAPARWSGHQTHGPRRLPPRAAPSPSARPAATIKFLKPVAPRQSKPERA